MSTKPTTATTTSEITFNLQSGNFIQLSFTPIYDANSKEPYQVTAELSSAVDGPIDSINKSLTNGARGQRFSLSGDSIQVNMDISMSNYGIVAAGSTVWSNNSEVVNMKGLVGAFYNPEHPGTTRSDNEFSLSHNGHTEHLLRFNIKGSGDTKTVDYIYLFSPSLKPPEQGSVPMPGDTATIAIKNVNGTVTKSGPVYRFSGTKNSGTVTTELNVAFACDL